MPTSQHLMPSAFYAMLIVFVSLLGLSALAVGKPAASQELAARTLGTTSTLANHDVWNPGPLEATGLRYRITPGKVVPADLVFTAFFMTSTHMMPTDTVPARLITATDVEFTWTTNVTDIKPLSMTHVGYTIRGCEPDSLGGAIEFVTAGAPQPILPTVVVNWCGKSTIANPLANTERSLFDGPGNPMTATILTLGSTPLSVTIRVGTTSENFPPNDLLPRLVDRNQDDPLPDFDVTFVDNLATLGPILVGNDEDLIRQYTYPGSVTANSRWLGIAVTVRSIDNPEELIARSFFARSVDGLETHPDDGPSPTPTPTGSPTPTGTPTPTGSPTPTGTPTPTDTPTPEPPPVSDVAACPSVEGKVAPAVISQALANPESISGYGQLCYPLQPISPFNPVRRMLDLQNPNRPHHPTFNPLIFKCGC